MPRTRDPRVAGPDRAGAANASAPPPGPPPPPPAPKRKQGTISAGTAFAQFVKAHGELRPYADLVWKWSRQYGVDAVELAALIFFESRGNPNARSGANALGLAQIHMPTWAGKKLPFGVVTEENAKNPAFAVRFAAWYFAQQREKYGDFDSAYRNGYNPGYKGPGPAALLPKDYVPRTGTLSPTERASVSVETSQARQTLTDPWVVIDKKGKVKYVNSAEPPKGASTTFGLPVRKSDFLRAWSHYNDIFTAYTGRPASAKQIASVLGKGWSDYALQNALSKTPQFKRSRVWAASAPAIVAYAKELYGDGWKVDNDLVRKAIIQNWSEGTLRAQLTKRPEYLKGPEFQGKVAGLQNVYMTIHGKPDEQALTTIREAALGGWSADQYAAWLRGQDSYKFSSEYQSKTLSFLDALGLITGGVPTLSKDNKPIVTATGQPTGQAAPPNSKRIAGKPGADPTNSLVAGY